MGSCQLAEAEPPAATAAPVVVPPAARILVIDDDATVRRVLSLCLGRLGYVVEDFCGAAHALHWLEQHPCDLVITDLMMPGCDGLETIQRLRCRQPGIKILAVSGGDSRGNSYLHVAHLLGAKHTLAKPFDLAHLADLVRKTLDHAA